MQIKRFEARDMAEALKMIKKEFGSEAVILSAKTIKKPAGILGTLKKSGVEITAASDRQQLPEVTADAALKPLPNIPGPASEWPENLIETALDSISLEKKRSPLDQNRPGSNSSDEEPPNANDPEIAALRLVLDDQGVCPSLCEEISDAVLRSVSHRRELTRQRIKKEFNRILEEKISIAPPILRAVGQPRTIALVGPSGAGNDCQADSHSCTAETVSGQHYFPGSRSDRKHCCAGKIFKNHWGAIRRRNQCRSPAEHHSQLPGHGLYLH